ncbi:MAG TPA: PAS domain S-box protein, partial [bacterium]
KSEATLRAVFNSGSQMIALIGKNGRLLDYNKSAAFNYEKIMGKKLESGKPFIDYVEPENKEFFRERFNRVLKGEFITLERSAKAVDGIEHWLEFTYNPVFDATGAITGMCMTGVLIDERKKGEEALRQSEEKFRKIFEDTSLGMAMVSDYRFIKVNRAFQVLLGYSEEELIGKTLFEITHPDDLVKSREIATKVHNAEKEIFKIEKRYIRKNGDSLWANVSGTLIRDGAGKKLYSLIMVENITERKKAQAALQKSEADLRAVFNSGSQVTVLITRDGRIQGFNKSAEVMAPHVLGRALEPGMFFAETLPQGASQEMFRSSFEAALEGRETKGERSIRAADGQARWVEVNYKPVINDHGGVDGVCFSLAFIDDRKKAERAIRESEEKFRKIFEDTSLGMSLVDRNFRFTHVNQAFCDLLGYTREEMIQISFKEITHPDDLPRNVAFSEDVKSGKGFQMQKRYLHKNDAVVWVNLTVTSFLDAQGELLYSLGMVENITEQKQSQEALQKSEAALKAVFNSGSQMVVLIGKDGRILDFNKNAEIQIEKVINLKFERGKLFNDYLLPQFKRVVQERLDRVLKGEFITVERPIRETDGIEHWFELAFNPVFDSQGLIAGVCLAAMPIDERRKVQEALQESEERYRRLVESSPEALLVHGEGRIIYMNPSGIKLLGASRLEELTGKSVLDIVHPHYRELVIARLRKLDQEGGLNESLEQKFVRLDGQVIDVEVKGIPFVYQGKPAGLALIRDITERKKAQATVLRYERLAGIGQVIAGIAHDIRNPLAVLSAMTQNIKERFGVSGSQSKEIEMIISQTERLKHFMNDILDYSKGLSLTKERIKPKYLLEQSLRLVKAQIGVDYEKIEVKWNSKEPLPDFSGDHDRLEQVLLNLLLNAYQAMEQGGTLTLILESQPGWMILKVEDDGPGIREADLTHLFEPFFTTKKHGSGLGLSLSQKIVEAHGGRIEVQKIVPHGTQFTLYLPL